MEYGCIGRKLTHSFSKIIHNMLTDYDYQLCELEPEAVAAFMQTADFKAINVTIPYKETVIPHLYYIDDKAKAIGAVNTIVNKNGKLYGYNTDFLGMYSLLSKNGIDPKGKKAAVLGTGGTSKTARAVLGYMGAKTIITVSRTKGEGVVTYDELYKYHADTEIIINTTPCGMYPNTEGAAVDIEKLPNLTGVADAVYNPLRTRLVSAALERGITAVGGLYMLVAQAVYAAEYFCDCEFDKAEIDRIYTELLKQKQNIVLVGMAGSGKTTLGKLLAKSLSREFVDTDAEIVKREGMSIPEIFERSGESGFRKIESEVISELSKEGALVIATGGGAVIKKENVTALKQNGRLFLLNRPLENIPATPDRPLSCDREKLTALYNSRLPIYNSVADCVVDCSGDIESSLKNLIEEL